MHRGPQGRIAITAKRVTLLKHCINKKINKYISKGDDSINVQSRVTAERKKMQNNMSPSPKEGDLINKRQGQKIITDDFSNSLSEKNNNDIPMEFCKCPFKATFCGLSPLNCGRISTVMVWNLPKSHL